MDWLKTLADGFQQVLDFFSNVTEFIIDFIGDIVYIIKITGEMVVKIPAYFSWLPSEALALVVSIFGVVVIYKVLGREG